MNQPPLPPAFGNYALKDFFEVVLPPGISAWPQTAGWLWFGALLLAWLAWRAWQLYRRGHRNRYRRGALSQIEAWTAASDVQGLAAAVNRLMKRAALAARPRAEVAALSGDAWPRWLNAQCERPPFDAARSTTLAQAPYRTSALDSATAQQLLDACRSWLREHRECGRD